MSIETTHREMKVYYAEDCDEWRCSGMELRAKTLTLLRKKIDKVLSIERKMDNLPIITMGDGWGSDYKLHRGHATLFDRGRNGSESLQVWVNLIKGNQTDRKKMRCEKVFLDTPENQARIKAVVDQNDAVRAEQKKLHDMEKELKAHCISELQVAHLATVRSVDDEIDPQPKVKK